MQKCSNGVPVPLVEQYQQRDAGIGQGVLSCCKHPLVPMYLGKFSANWRDELPLLISAVFLISSRSKKLASGVFRHGPHEVLTDGLDTSKH